MIKLVRIDHRLLHGQVVFRWSKILGIDCILIASDTVCKDELRMSALRLAKPAECKLVIKSIQDSATSLNSGVTDKYKLLVIVENVEDAYRLCKEVSSIKQINFGGTKMQEGKRQISKAVFVSKEEIELINQMSEQGIEMFVQMVPDDTKEDIMKLIKREIR